ncbi:MAG: rRNA maturation RNase YbeY [Flavobacteriales bacterium]|jgi:probable rRNA maturation factor|tara:strand:- start:22 stop:435 length:414 start_codon:yes stop_codon:yes gene_type:complete
MIEYHYENDFILVDSDKIRIWIEDVIKKEKKTVGDITYIFCDDDYLLERNKEFLDHNTLTDIITFNYCIDNNISSDIMISIDRVKENSTTFENSFNEELKRVMIHGILHLIGYNDKSDKEKELMREKENFYLNMFYI